jgi:hypothetical protein
MEPSVSLQIQKSNKQYPIRILKYNNICIDENHVMYPTVDDTTVTPIETHALSSDEKDGLEELYESYKAFQAAKSAYEAVSETFWKSAVGTKLKSILVPDPLCYDRTLLQDKIKAFEYQLFKQVIQIKSRSVDISGYNYIVVKYVLIMYESHILPSRVSHDFVLQTIHERVVDEIPKLWTNKMIIQRKKIVDCVYVSGHMLPPYRLKDSAALATATK